MWHIDLKHAIEAMEEAGAVNDYTVINRIYPSGSGIIFQLTNFETWEWQLNSQAVVKLDNWK